MNCNGTGQLRITDTTYITAGGLTATYYHYSQPMNYLSINFFMLHYAISLVIDVKFCMRYLYATSMHGGGWAQLNKISTSSTPLTKTIPGLDSSIIAALTSLQIGPRSNIAM